LAHSRPRPVHGVRSWRKPTPHSRRHPLVILSVALIAYVLFFY
jgi:hypothetical protein